MLGYWREAAGSVIHVHACGSDVCATLVVVSPSAPTRADANNPDLDLQHRLLCGLRIGGDFHLTWPDKAEGGSLYDPKSGKTYHGVMQSHGDELDLRGYVGLPVFGWTEKWSRTHAVEACLR